MSKSIVRLLERSEQKTAGEKHGRAALRNHREAIAIGALFLALSLFYNITIPLWESDNEWSHYQYVRYIVMEQRLPRPDTQIAVAPTNDICDPFAAGGMTTVHQFRQPPLYYLLASSVVAGMDLSNDSAVINNPHLHTGQGGVNVAVHTAAESFPYTGTVLAVHRIRLFSALVGLAGLIATYLIGLALFPTRRWMALAMLAINAFVPQYIFSGSVVNNDILAGALGAWCLYFCLHYVQQRAGFGVLMLAMLLAILGIMAKYSSLILLPALLLAITARLFITWRYARTEFAAQLHRILLVLLLSSLPVIVWLARNQMLTGHLLGDYAYIFVSLFQSESGATVSNVTLHPLRATQFMIMTFWGLFGNDNITYPDLVLVILQATFVLAIAGVLWVAFDRRQAPRLRWTVAAVAGVVIIAWVINLFKAIGTAEPRGRYFLPIYALFSFLLALGLNRLLPRRWQHAGTVFLLLLLLILSLITPPWLLHSPYAQPALAASDLLLPNEQPLHVIFGDTAELVGYSIEPQRLSLFEPLTVTLVWRVLHPAAGNYTVAVDLLDGDHQSLYRSASFPGNGNFATSLWQPGDIFRDVYRVWLAPNARPSLPGMGRVKVSMYCYSPETVQPLPVTNAAGQSLGDAVSVGRIKLAAEADAQPTPTTEPLFDFGGEIALQKANYSPSQFPYGKELTIQLDWRALAQPTHDYTVFVHLLDGQGHPVASYDVPLTNGRYPSGLWEAGEQVTHQQILPLNNILLTGEYSLRMGLYDPASGARLPARDAQGNTLSNAEAPIGTLSGPDNFQFLPDLWQNRTVDTFPDR